MNALVFHGPEVVRCESVDDPVVGAPHEALVRVEMSAICGSDLHVYRGHETGLEGGTVLGHEFLGTVVDVGAAVQDFGVGDRVVAPFTTSCGSCYYCVRGLTCRCTSGQLFGWVEAGGGLHGAQAELVRVPLADGSLVAVPNAAVAEEALFCGDVLSTGFFCAESADVGPGVTAAVVGCGPVGLMGVVASRELGAARVFAIDVVPERLKLAAKYGAEPVNASECDAVEVLRDATDGRGADCVLEAVGSPQATRVAVDLVRPGGTLAACGVHTESTFAFAPGEAYDKNLTYRAGRCPARHYMDRTLSLVCTRKYDLAAIISHRMPLDGGARGYEIFDKKLDGCTKVLLELV